MRIPVPRQWRVRVLHLPQPLRDVPPREVGHARLPLRLELPNERR